MTDFFILDTNVLISATLMSNSTSRKVLDKVRGLGKIASSRETITEFMDVLYRKKFDTYFLFEDERLVIIDRIERNSIIINPEISITACRDPKDDKFLELAVAAKASCIITGDDDLLVLNPFRSISILNPSDFLEHF